jgi:phage tail-like protein
MMAAGAETVVSPFTAFSFEVVLTLATPVPGVGDPVCHGAFSECDGLEITIEPKSIASGGASDVQVHLAGPARYGQLTLRRGMTQTADLWAWVAAVAVPGRALTADGQITMYDGAHALQARFVVTGCLPVRLRGPALNAQTGLVAVEELGLAVGHLALASSGGGTGAAVGIGFSASAGVSASAGISASAGVAGAISVGGGAQVSGGLGLSGSLGGTFSGSAGASLGVG